MAKRLREEYVSEISGLESVSGNSELTTSTPENKYLQMDSSTPFLGVIHCSLPPHRQPIGFATYEDYEVHYVQSHVNRCIECGKNFPSELYLSRHIEENHDPLIEARRERGEKTLGCFVEGCRRRCSTPQKRRLHLIDKHSFPRTYNFFITNDGIDKHNSLLTTCSKRPQRVQVHAFPYQQARQRRSGPINTISDTIKSPTEHESLSNCSQTLSEPQVAIRESSETSIECNTLQGIDKHDDIADLTKSISALKFVPPSVTIRRIKGQGGFSTTTS